MKFIKVSLLVLLSIIISISKCQTTQECIRTEAWKNYKQNYDINFKNEKKEKEACYIYEQSVVELANLKKQRADLTYDIGETGAMHLNLTNYVGDVPEISTSRSLKMFRPKTSKNRLPTSFSYVDHGFDTPAKYQGDCASCYTFSAIGAIEGQNFICNKDKEPLSEQYLLDCSPLSNGCGAGNKRIAETALTKGVPYGKDYKYVIQDCSYNEWYDHVKVKHNPECHSQKKCYLEKKNGFKIDSVEQIERGNEYHLLAALVEIGPIPVSFYIPTDIRYYQNKVYDNNNCLTTRTNHAALLVGYTPEYFILKNSWGPKWGFNGYMRMARKSNSPNGRCAILYNNIAVRKNGCRRSF